MPSFKKMHLYHHQLTISWSLEVVKMSPGSISYQGRYLPDYSPLCDVITWKHFAHYWPFVKGLHLNILHGFPTPDHIPYLPYLTRHPYINAARCPGGHVWDYYAGTLSTDGNSFAHQVPVWFHLLVPCCQASNISRKLVCNKIVITQDLVGALPVGTASTTSSFPT